MGINKLNTRVHTHFSPLWQVNVVIRMLNAKPRGWIRAHNRQAGKEQPVSTNTAIADSQVAGGRGDGSLRSPQANPSLCYSVCGAFKCMNTSMCVCAPPPITADGYTFDKTLVDKQYRTGVRRGMKAMARRSQSSASSECTVLLLFKTPSFSLAHTHPYTDFYI